MFNLFNSVYLCSRASYETSQDQIVLDPQLTAMVNIKGSGKRLYSEESLKALLDKRYSGNIESFFKDLIQKQTGERGAKSICIYVSGKDMVSLLAYWYRFVFTNANLPNFMSLLELYRKDYETTFCLFRTIKDVNADAYLEELTEAMDKAHVTESFKKATITIFSTPVKNHLRKEMPFEYLLLRRTLCYVNEDLVLDERIFRMLANMFTRNIYVETRYKLLQALPRVHLADETLAFDPMDKTSLIRFMSEPEAGSFLRNPVVSREALRDKDQRKVIFSYVEKFAMHDSSGLTNLNYRYFMEAGFNYQGLVHAVKNAKANIVFHERDFYWNEINHSLIGLFVDVIKGQLKDEYKTLLKGLKDVSTR